MAHPENLEKLNPVKLYRLAAGLTQAQLARRAGLAQATVCAIELGRQRVYVDTVAALAEVLGVGVGELSEGLVSWRRERADAGGAAA